MTKALNGTSTDPVMRKSSTKVARAMTATTQGRPSSTAERKSSWLAACPVTQVSAGAARSRTAWTARSLEACVPSPARSR